MTGSEDNPLAILAAKESVSLVKILVAGVVVLYTTEVTMKALGNLTARVRKKALVTPTCGWRSMVSRSVTSWLLRLLSEEKQSLSSRKRRRDARDHAQVKASFW